MSDLLQTAVGWLSWFWLSILFAAVFVELLWLAIVVLRAWDRNYDETTCREARPFIDVDKALRRRVSWPRIGLTFYAVWVALVVVFFREPSVALYAVIATAWFVATPLRGTWAIATLRKIERNAGNATKTTLWGDVSFYYGRGLQLPYNHRHQPWFVGRLVWLNRFQNLRYVFHVFRAWGIFVQAIVAAAWPISACAAIFFYMEKLDRYATARPWWRFDRSLT